MNEVWIFADWNPLTKKERDTILYMNVTDVVLGVAMGPTEWKPTFSEKQIIEHVKWITDNGMRAHLMIWLYREPQYIKDAGHWLRRQYRNCVLNNLTLSSILFDCEKHWHLGKHMKLKEAMSYINKHFSWAFDEPFLNTGVTGLAKLQPSVKPMLELCDYGIGQGYAVWFPNNTKHFSHTKKYEPGNPEKIVHESWSKHSPNKIIMGLACYYEQRPARYGLPPMSQIEALNQSLEATYDMGYTRCAYWSLNHCVGNSITRNTRRDFIKELLPNNLIKQASDSIPPEPIKTTHKINYDSLQWLLTKLNYNPGPIDNKLGPKTKEALEKFRVDNSYETKVPMRPNYMDMHMLVTELRKIVTNKPKKLGWGGWDMMDHLIPLTKR